MANPSSQPPHESLRESPPRSADSSSNSPLPRRDELAVIRTHLANERTLLAYIRTALMLAGTGGTLLKFFGDDFVLRVTGFVFVAASGLVMVVGFIRFRSSARRTQRVAIERP